jgi:hypothetical protein
LSQRAAIRLRRRFKIKFRDIAERGRPKYPGEVSAAIAAKRLRAVIEKQQLMQRRKKAGG